MLVNLGKRLDSSTEEGELEISSKLSAAGVFLVRHLYPRSPSVETSSAIQSSASEQRC